MIKAQNIIFDIDGTLVNTSRVSIPAFEMVLKQLQNDGFNIGNHTKEEIMKYIGFTIDEIWKNLFKNDDPVLIEKAIRYLDHYEEFTATG
ncbi:MAG TPA: HAD hydrolase-like protein [Petrotogaceae bacterium]|nr:HAD hydrolase-like protein [Petrotogaceae bacterium]